MSVDDLCCTDLIMEKTASPLLQKAPLPLSRAKPNVQPMEGWDWEPKQVHHPTFFCAAIFALENKYEALKGKNEDDT